MKRWLCTVLVTWMAASAAAAATDAAGYVLSLHGRWSLQGSGTALTVGSAVPAGAQIVAEAPGSLDQITIVAARGGALLLSQRCRQPADCARPLALRTPAPDDGPGLLERIVARLAGEPDRYVTTLSRGAAPPPAVVLAVAADGVDVGPALGSLPSGRYTIQLAPLRCSGGPPCDPAAALPPHERKAGQGALLPVSAPGVYELMAMPVPGTGVPQRPSTRVLLAAPGAQAKLAQRLAAGVALTASWGAEVDAQTKRAYLYALLDVLAEP